MKRAIILLAGLLILSLVAVPLGDLNTASAQGCAAHEWAGSFFNSRDLTGAVAASICNTGIDFDWGGGAPLNGVGIDNWSARWTTTQTFATPGTYQFNITVDDGARLFVNGQLIIDAFTESNLRTVTGTFSVPAPNSQFGITLDFVEYTGNARIKLEWFLVGSVSGTGGGEPWTVEYFNNLTWTAPAVAITNAAADGISIDYQGNAPAAGVNADGWSSRWTRGVTFPAGTYTFNVRADDGVKIRVDGNEILNQAQFIGNINFTGQVFLSDGRHVITVEHFDETAFASLFVTWSPAVGTTLAPGGGAVAAPAPASPAPVVTGSATATINTSGLYFRRTPQQYWGNILTTLRSGQQYPAIGRSGDGVWVQLSANGQSGWSIARFVILSSPIANLPVTDGTSQASPLAVGATGVQARTTGWMKIRSGPGYNYPRVSGIGIDTLVNVTGRSPDGQWLQVQVGDIAGWSYSSYYDIVVGSLNNVPIIQG
jgi:uncharacterized protein YraI